MFYNRKAGLRICSLLIGTFAATALMGCPPPDTASSPNSVTEAVSQRVLDSLRVVSERRCRSHYSFAYNYARSDLRDDAMTQFQKALGHCRDTLKAEVERIYAQYLDQWEMTDSAFAHYYESGQLDTTNSRVHFWLYSYYHDNGQYDDAISELLIAARHQEDAEVSLQWTKAAADMMAAEGLSERACETYSYLQQLAPENGEIAQAMVESGCVDDPEALLSTLRSACAADTLGAICTQLADEEEKFGNDEQALAIYQRFADANPSDVTMWDAVLRISRRMGRSDVVLAALGVLVEREPDNPERASQLIDELFALRRWREGGDLLRDQLRAHPDHARLLYLGGIYYTRPGTSEADTTRALGYLDRAVRTNDPDWKRTAMDRHDALEPPLSEEEINQAKFFGRPVSRLHRCTIPGREKQNEVLPE